MKGMVAMKKRMISLLLAVAMVISLLPSTILRADAVPASQPIISVEEVWGASGSTVEVDVNITGNPGILGATLTLSWHEGLTLISAEEGTGFAGLTYQEPSYFSNTGTNFVWYGTKLKTVQDGTVLKLTFEVGENAVEAAALEINITGSGITDQDKNPVTATFVNGCVRVLNYKPGDVDDSGEIDPYDLIILAQFISDGCKTDPNGYNVAPNISASDVNDDGEYTPLDLIMISQFIADGCVTDPDGYNVILKPSTPKCSHTMEYTPYKAPTCTEDGNVEYYHCTTCDKYYNDSNGTKEILQSQTVMAALGHDSVSVDTVPATPTTEGYTAGVWCNRCEIWLEGHDVIPPIEPDESNIAYRHYVLKEDANGAVNIVYDAYLDTHGINNPNPVTYVEGIGVVELIEGVPINGQKVSANGYSFLGWYEKPEATAKRVYSISPEETGDKVLYGVWSKEVYTITYLPDSASSILPRVEDGSYSVDKETSLSEPPQWPNLVWVGWSDENGKIVKSIPEGTTGNITLTANWMSRRSQTVPNTKYASNRPAVAIDEENGIYAFIYEIGEIQNVPIQQVENGKDGKGFNLVKGQTHRIEEKITQKMEVGETTTVANTIANATTKSDSWTLSEDWNKSTSFSQEHSNEVSQEQSQKAATTFSESGKYSLSSGIGGSEEHIDETGKSTKTTSKHEVGVSVNVGAKAYIKAGVTAATPFKNASVEANVGIDYKYSKETEKETHETHTDSTSSYWNVNEGFETSQELSQTNEFSQTIAQSIRDTYSYGETLDYGGSNSNTVSSSNTTSESREYASSVHYSMEEGKEYTVEETLTADADTGFYRKVLAANFKVFGVVIYDMKENTFSTMSYSLKIKDSEHLFTDYSTVSSFDDYENGVLPFEVPSFVGDYVYGLVGASEGLVIDDETGIVERYGYKDPETGICYKRHDEKTGIYSDPCDTDVIIPRYKVVTVGGSQKKIVPVTGFDASAFAGTTVTSVYLSEGITGIPNGAFEDCEFLKYVRGGRIDSIGENAFKNCISLFEFELPDAVTNMGDNAFEDVEALTVHVSNAEVLEAALASGVKRLTVDLKSMEGIIDGEIIDTPDYMEYFRLMGGGREFNNLSVVSDANEVVLNNITITNNGDIPLHVTSPNVTLSFTKLNARGLVMRLDAESTEVTLDGNNYLTSVGDNAMLGRNISFYEKVGSSASGKLRIAGNALYCGSVYGEQRVSFDSKEHTFVELTQEEYENLLTSSVVIFEPNGGSVSVGEMRVGYGQPYGELPIPEYDYHAFLGWYTEKDGGTEVTSDTLVTSVGDHMLYAHWELNPVSDWVRASEVPADAEVLNQKWTYTETTNKESRETHLDGYNRTGSYWVQSGSGSQHYASFPGGFDTGNWHYQNFAKSVPYSAYENETSRRDVSNHWAGYVYWHWMYDTNGANAYNRRPFYQRGYNSENGYGYYNFYAWTSTTNYGSVSHSGQSGWTWYEVKDSHTSNAESGGSYYWYRFDYYTSYYTDYYKMFQYQKVENKESFTEVRNGGSISNVQEWVQYRAK